MPCVLGFPNPFAINYLMATEHTSGNVWLTTNT